MAGTIGSIFKSMWSEPKELTMAERWAEEEKEEKEGERQLQQQERDARERKEREEQAKREQEWEAWRAQQPPESRSESQTSEQRWRPSQSGNAGRRKPSTPRKKCRTSQSPSGMGESSEREKIRQAVLRKALAT